MKKKESEKGQFGKEREPRNINRVGGREKRGKSMRTRSILLINRMGLVTCKYRIG